MLEQKPDFIQSRRAILKGSIATALMGVMPYIASAKEAKESKKAPLPSHHLKFPLRLDSNENSLGMSPKAKQAILDNLDDAFRYLKYNKTSARTHLAELIAKDLGFKIENIVLGNGSSEVIEGIIYAFVSQARKQNKPVQIIVPDPTFEAPQWYGKPMGVKIAKVGLNKNFELDIPGMQKLAKEFEGNSIVYICNPNNPTGTLASGSDIQNWMDKADSNIFFLFDEAYGEYAGSDFQSALKYIKAGKKNLIVSKTFSKIYALAGLRIGYGVASKEVLDLVNGFMEIDNINYLAAYAAIASLEDKPFREKSIQSNQMSRKILMDTLDELKIKYLPTHANFMFYNIKGDLKTYQKRMLENQIVVGREFPPYKSWNRISLGTPEEMKIVVATLKKFRTKGWI